MISEWQGGKKTGILQGHHKDLQSRVLENEQVEFLLRIYIMEKEGRKIGVKKRKSIDFDSD